MTSAAFTTTRSILEQLDDWVATLASPLGAPVRVPEPDGAFHWEFPRQSPEVLQIGKLVRMVSGVRAAMSLADQGFTTESASILRMVSDYGQEILAIGEGLLEGRMTPAQQKFVDQYFAPLPRTAEDFAASERERYVSREELLKAQRRMVEKTPVSADELFKNTRFLNKGFDTYVHGGYLTAMELYHGDDGRFMLRGHKGERGRCAARVAVAGKLHEVLVATMFVAMVQDIRDVVEAARTAMADLQASAEMSNAACGQISGRQAAV